MDLKQLISVAVENGASDIHITPGTPPIIRCNGELLRVGKDKLTPEESAGFAEEIFKIADYRAAFEERGEIDFSFAFENFGRFRVNVYKQRGSIAIAIRLIPMEIPDIGFLGLPDSVVKLAYKTRGLVLVTGPTGAGKSTTLAALINKINEERNCHIITLEDPIEYLHKHKTGIVNQREIGIDSKTFANALRAALREDPDVIMIGEMRDQETIATALTAAETGHLVFGTLHTMGASKTIDRIVDSFPESQQQQVRVQLSSVLQSVITQQLISANDKVVPAFEVMMVTHGVANMIRESKTHQIDNLIQTGNRYGMQTMDGTLMGLYKQGKITKEDVLAYCFDPEIMEKMLID
ncbi:MAG: type IV pilus twitching motility protein PilT [Clostridia bacterium]|nr:type IV pilus twitching motility protein PilT [Clostridia bacterium]